MIDICAIGPLRVTSGLFNAGLLKSGAKVRTWDSEKHSLLSIDYSLFIISYHVL